MPSPRKIVILGSAYPLRGGLAAYNERLASAFSARGDDVIIYTFSLQYPRLLFPGKTQYSSDPVPLGLDIRVKVNSINPFNWLIIGREIQRMKPDLLIIKYWLPFMAPCFGTIARMVKKNKHTRIVSILDNIIPHEKRPGDRILSKYFVKAVDGFVAMSHSVLKDLELFTLSKKRAYCPHPLYDNFGECFDKISARKRLGLVPSSRYILFFGFIRDYKGLDLLLKAMANERLVALNVNLIIAGEFYTDSKPYLGIIEKHRLSGRIVMATDFIPDSKVGAYFCASELVVQPYKHATQSGVTQIAYHFNKPMIITDVGGLAEFIPHEKVGYVVAPDPDEIAAAICRFYDEGKELEFSSNAAIEKQKYSWDRMIEAIESVAGI